MEKDWTLEDYQLLVILPFALTTQIVASYIGNLSETMLDVSPPAYCRRFKNGSTLQQAPIFWWVGSTHLYCSLAPI